MRKLRLLLFSNCERNCPGCCNLDWNLQKLPICVDYSPYDMIMLTGGEPMLRPDIVKVAIRRILQTSKARIYLYTAVANEQLLVLLASLDGITLTLHEQSDVAAFLAFNERLRDFYYPGGTKSLRLNIFEGVSLGATDLSAWVVKGNIKWIKDCPLPTDEVFMRWSSVL